MYTIQQIAQEITTLKPDYTNHIAKYKRTLTNSAKAITEINNTF